MIIIFVSFFIKHQEH